MSTPWALARYQVISAYIALPPPRGRRRAVLEQLAARSWIGPDGEFFRVSAETIRGWARRYRKGGLSALEDAPRARRGVTVLDDTEVATLCALKQEVPERSLDRLIRIAEDLSLLPAGKARRSTVHRALRAHGLSGRKAKPSTPKDLDRWEADFPNELWQSDMLEGAWLPDPVRPGKVRRTYLYAYLDDHSRRCVRGGWDFKGDSPALELVFRRSMQIGGVPRRVYYDNGATYKAHHMRHIVATMGIHGILFTEVRRPEGHGKIEKFNQLVTNAFVAEIKASGITTLDALNEAWNAWVERYYNDEIHGETGEKPNDRWRKGLANIRFAEESRIREAFLWTEARTADKAGLFSLFGTEYQVGPALARRRFDVRYDPEDLSEVEVWLERKLIERVKPFVVGRHRRPKAATPGPAPAPAAPTGNWLGHLVAEHRKQNFVEPTARMLAEAEARRRAEADLAVVDVLATRLDPAVLDAPAARAFLTRFGPWDAERVTTLLDIFLAHNPRDLHVQVYLDHIHAQIGGKP